MRHAKVGVLVGGVLAALASSAWAGNSGSHVHVIGNANAGATVVSASQMQTGYLFAAAGADVKGHIHLHGTHGNHVHIKFDSSNNMGFGSAFATTIVGGYTVISRSIVTFNSAAAVTVAAQQNFALSTVWGTYLCGPVFVSTWTQASGAFNGQLGLSLTAVAAGGAATTTIVNAFGSAGVMSGVWSNVIVTSSSALTFHSATFNSGLMANFSTAALIGGAAVVYAPCQTVLVLSASSWGSVWTTVVANAALAGYGVVLIGS